MTNLLENTKERASAMGEKLQDTFEDNADRLNDKKDELVADGKVKKQEAELKSAEAERDDVKSKNDFKEDLRT